MREGHRGISALEQAKTEGSQEEAEPAAEVVQAWKEEHLGGRAGAEGREEVEAKPVELAVAETRDLHARERAPFLSPPERGFDRFLWRFAEGVAKLEQRKDCLKRKSVERSGAAVRFLVLVEVGMIWTVERTLVPILRGLLREYATAFEALLHHSEA